MTHPKEDREKTRHDDIAVSSRARLARNLRDFPFPNRLKGDQAEKVLDLLSSIFLNIHGGRAFRLVRLTGENRLEGRVLVERHLISPELANGGKPRGVILSGDETVSIMLGEEDHARIQVLSPGLRLQECLKEALRVDDLIDEHVSYAFHEDLGYLTACPTNLGTALRASVMLHLSALTESGAIRDVVTAAGKMGLAVRGLYGEGSQIQGSLYQVSNQSTLGLTEAEIVSRVTAVVEHIITQETTLRQVYLTQQPQHFKNRVWRAWGLLTHARLLSSEEAMTLLSDLRWGVAEGELPPVPMMQLNSLIQDIQPGSLMQKAGRPLDAPERNAVRADIMRESLRGFMNAKA